MALKWTADLNRIVSSAQRDADKMHIRLNTALLLRSMVKNTSPAQAILVKIGIDLKTCESGLRAMPLQPESVSAPQRIYERASRIAMCAHLSEISSVQVLQAFLEEPCMGQSLLEVLHIDIDSFRTALYGYAAPEESCYQYHRSTTSMSAVAVQTKSISMRPATMTFIAPEPAASFGGEMLLGCEHAIPGSPKARFLKSKESSLSSSDKIKKPSTAQSTRSGSYRSTTSKEIQQATTLDLARRLLQKRAQSRESLELSVDKNEVQNCDDNISNVILKQDDPITKLQEELDIAKTESPSDVVLKNTTEVKTPQQNVNPIAQQVLGASTYEKQTHDNLASEVALSRKKQISVPISNPKPQPLNRDGSVCSRKPSHKKWPSGSSPTALNSNVFPALSLYGRNLLSEAVRGKIDAVIGRDDEMNQLVDILNKRRCNNPVLVGESGVGKTAIIEGLAYRMAHHQAPPSLENKTIIALDYGAILCGTQLRGAVQERIKKIKDEVKKANGLILLFLDEIHSWLTTANGDPNSDAAFELKMALSRGELMCIGASTPAELRRAFNTDPAFERRFDFIEVKAPSPETSVRIIESGIIHQYAHHHHVTYDGLAIREAVRLSNRYIQERALPDKAISILDRAGSLCERSGETTVTPEHVARIIAQIAEIPVERLLMSERQKLMQMETILGKHLIGHSENIAQIASVIRRNQAGFGAQRPIGSFLFLGPTGVGKTETAKVLADFLFGSPKHIVRFDMSEFMEQHSVAKLIGAPAGYVGFDDGGQLTEALRKRPYQIVLFDEIEKAHPDVMNILLQILDEGRLTDSKGRHVDFSNTVIIMTSNLGAQNLANAMNANIGFANATEKPSSADAKNIILKSARAHFSPELWNRIEEKLIFMPLSIEEVERIAHLLLANSAKRLQNDKDIALSFDETAVIPFLIKNGGFDPAYGARPMRKTIQSLIESRVAEWILNHEILPKELFVGIRDDQVFVDPVQPLLFHA